MLVLEPLDAARARNARIYANWLARDSRPSAHHIPRSRPFAVTVRAMRAALEDSRLAPETIGYINAHGTRTLGNDPTEARASPRRFWRPHAGARGKLDQVPARPCAGRGGSARGAVTTRCWRLLRGVLPTSWKIFTAPGWRCELCLDVVPNQAREARVEAAASTEALTSPFGSHLNAVLALARHADRDIASVATKKYD